MPLFRWMIIRGGVTIGMSFLCVLLFAPRAAAQAGPSWAFGAGLEASSVPDAFSTRCDNQGTLGWGIGGSVAYRPAGPFVIAGDVHMVRSTFPTGCDLMLELVQVAPGVWETRPDPVYSAGVPRLPLMRSSVRMGLETPSRLPLVRLSLGTGAFWSGCPTPYGLAAIGVGTRGKAARFYAELEEDVSRVRGVEHRQRFREDSTGEVALGTVDVPMLLHPHWGMVHAGVEIPLRALRRHD